MNTTALPGRRQLFIYWRVARADVASAQAAARQLQNDLRTAHAGLRTELFRRGGEGLAETTFMETYALVAPGAGSGISAALQQEIVEAGQRALQPWLRSARHVEAFDLCGA